MLLLDTSAASGIMHRQPDTLRRLRDEDPSTVWLCAPVAAEIQFGLARLDADSRRRRLLEAEFQALRAALRWTDWPEPAALAFGYWKARLEERGRRIDDMDLAIASIAISLPARLATFTARHFSTVEALQVDDWSDARQK